MRLLKLGPINIICLMCPANLELLSRSNRPQSMSALMKTDSF